MAAVDILRTEWNFSKLGLRVQWKAPRRKRIFQNVVMKEESVYSSVETPLCCAWTQKKNPKEFEREFQYCEAWPLIGGGKPPRDSFEVDSYVFDDEHLQNFKVTIDATAWTEGSAPYPDGFRKGLTIRCSEGHTSPVPAYRLYSCSGRREVGEHMLVRKFVYEVRRTPFPEPELEDGWVTASGNHNGRYWHCKYYEKYADDFSLTDKEMLSQLRI